MPIAIHEFSPVIFAGTNGGAGEYHASNDPNNPEEHIIEANLPHPGGRIIEAWQTPLHNLAAIPAFALIDVNRHNNRQVRLRIAAYAGQNNRLRIKIHVLYEY